MILPALAQTLTPSRDATNACRGNERWNGRCNLSSSQVLYYVVSIIHHASYSSTRVLGVPVSFLHQGCRVGFWSDEHFWLLGSSLPHVAHFQLKVSGRCIASEGESLGKMSALSHRRSWESSSSLSLTLGPGSYVHGEKNMKVLVTQFCPVNSL